MSVCSRTITNEWTRAASTGMNKNAHRLVYAWLRGMVVAVAETATADGKSATGEARAQRRSSMSGARVVVAGVA
ncbi:ESPR-type extended signal peptide-containing protein, partial [Burkholderia multivorans]|uniref:ESPR-type extended signal peptide-containing protein n=1 Tax=Burkholderia multivorans TaxID=87883 RepID=UPI00345E35EB